MLAAPPSWQWFLRLGRVPGGEPQRWLIGRGQRVSASFVRVLAPIPLILAKDMWKVPLTAQRQGQSNITVRLNPRMDHSFAMRPLAANGKLRFIRRKYRVQRTRLTLIEPPTKQCSN
jgi:hypothetical protein